MQIQKRQQLIQQIADEVLDRNFERFKDMAYDHSGSFSCKVGAINRRLYVSVNVYDEGSKYVDIEIENMHRERDHTYPNVSMAVSMAIGEVEKVYSIIRRECAEPRYDF